MTKDKSLRSVKKQSALKSKLKTSDILSLQLGKLGYKK